jgi:xanthine dehydrogenase accessory factor
LPLAKRDEALNWLPGMSIAPAPADVLKFLALQGEQTVLITLVAVHGSASRAVGTQMAVAADGSACGSFSGGCIEAAVVSEALAVLESGVGRTVRYGAGSPYIDVKLPCGGGIDLLFTPRPSLSIVHAALAALAARSPFEVAISAESLRRADSQGFQLAYHPQLRIIALGQGDDLAAFARLAERFGAETIAIVPAEQVAGLGPLPGVEVLPVPARTHLPEVSVDPWTAIIFLFHDRDWEEFLLPKTLALPAFYHGAIGSPRSQAARQETMIAGGVAADHLARLRRSVGLIPSTRDPATLALSILADVVADYRALVAQ